MTNQIPFGTDEFAQNPEPRCPCVLLLDTSGSMTGQPIEQLNNGLSLFKSKLLTDHLAAKRVDLAIVTFGPVRVAVDFTSVLHFDSQNPPRLEASGDTPMGAAIVEALDRLEARKSAYRSNGIAYYRPWVFLITDGAPTDDWAAAARRVREGENGKKFAFFAVGVEHADMEILRKLSVRDPLRLKGLEFRSLFQWLSSSMKAVSRSNPGDDIKFINPAAPGGWAKL